MKIKFQTQILVVDYLMDIFLWELGRQLYIYIYIAVAERAVDLLLWNIGMTVFQELSLVSRQCLKIQHCISSFYIAHDLMYKSQNSTPQEGKTVDLYISIFLSFYWHTKYNIITRMSQILYSTATIAVLTKLHFLVAVLTLVFLIVIIRHRGTVKYRKWQCRLKLTTSLLRCRR